MQIMLFNVCTDSSHPTLRDLLTEFEITAPPGIFPTHDPTVLPSSVTFTCCSHIATVTSFNKHIYINNSRVENALHVESVERNSRKRCIYKERKIVSTVLKVPMVHNIFNNRGSEEKSIS